METVSKMVPPGSINLHNFHPSFSPASHPESFVSSLFFPACRPTSTYKVVSQREQAPKETNKTTTNPFGPLIIIKFAPTLPIDPHHLAMMKFLHHFQLSSRFFPFHLITDPAIIMSSLYTWPIKTPNLPSAAGTRT